MAKFLLATLLLSSVFVAIHCECCGQTYIQYRSNRKTCHDIPGGSALYGVTNADSDTLSVPCLIRVCGDGLSHQGFYCGEGPCNAFGCNCDGGCIPGNAKKEFKARYGDRVIDV